MLLGSAAMAVEWARAQDAPAVDSAVALVRARYAAIQAARLDSAVVAYTTPGGSGTVTRHREGGALRKVAVRFDGDGASGFSEYYYWDDTLVFAYDRWERYPEQGPERRGENRVYLAGGRAVRWIRTDEDGRRRTMGPGAPEFATVTGAMITAAACWRRYAEAGVSGEVEC